MDIVTAPVYLLYSTTTAEGQATIARGARALWNDPMWSAQIIAETQAASFEEAYQGFVCGDEDMIARGLTGVAFTLWGARAATPRVGWLSGSEGAIRGRVLGAVTRSIDLSKVPQHARRARQYDFFKVLPDKGRIRYYSEFRPAKTPGPKAGARYVTEVDSRTGLSVRTWQELYDAAGRVVEVHPKTPKDLGHIPRP